MVAVLLMESRRDPRERMARLLSAAPGIRYVDRAATSAELLKKFTDAPVGLVFLSAHVDREALLDTTERLLALRRGTNVVVFGAPYTVHVAALAIKRGACGFLSCDASSGRGRVLPDQATTVPSPRASTEHRPVFSSREIEVLRGMSLGKTNGEIGDDLNLSEDTIKTHAQRLYRKLSVTDRAHAVVHGLRRNLID